jgi:NitT/TauT family transport system substrate-binding protein
MPQFTLTRLGFVLAIGLLLGACGQPAPATPAAPAAQQSASAPRVVRLGYFPNITHAAALVGTGNGLFREALGANVTLETKTFNAGPALIEALLANEIDIAYIGPNPAINGFVKSNGAALRIIAGAASGGAALVVRPAANITSVQDLAGKKVGTPQLGNTQDVALRYYLQENGLAATEKGGTVQVIPTANADILRLFQQGELDAAWVPEPWVARLVLEANGTILLDERTRWPDGKFVTTNVIASKQFLDAHPQTVTDFLGGHLAAIALIQKDPTAAKQIINTELEKLTTRGLPPAVLDKSFDTIEVTHDPLAATLFVSAEHAFALGFLGTEQPDLQGIYQLEPLNAALTKRGMPTLPLP